MSNSPKKNQSSPLPGDDRNVVAAGSPGTEVSFEESLYALWTKNGRFILIVIALGFVAIVGREVVTYMWKERERGISEAYGAADSTAKLKSFAAEHASHKLAGLAWMRIADEAYTARNFTEAIDAYGKAGPLLKDTPMADRAKIGAALSQCLGGDRPKGEAALKALADDITLMAPLRSEVRYHLATLAIGDGRIDDARKQLDDLAQTDLTGMWAQRAFVLRATLPAAGAVAAAPTNAPPPAPSSDIPELKLNLPGGKP